MRTLVGWTIVFGIACHFFGIGAAFSSLAGELLAMAAVLGTVLLVIDPRRRVGQLLGPLFLATVAIGFSPAFFAGGLHDLTRSLSWTTVIVLLGGAQLVAILSSKR